MMLFSTFCKICELNTKYEIDFALISVDSQGDIARV